MPNQGKANRGGQSRDQRPLKGQQPQEAPQADPRIAIHDQIGRKIAAYLNKHRPSRRDSLPGVMDRLTAISQMGLIDDSSMFDITRQLVVDELAKGGDTMRCLKALSIMRYDAARFLLDLHAEFLCLCDGEVGETYRALRTAAYLAEKQEGCSEHVLYFTFDGVEDVETCTRRLLRGLLACPDNEHVVQARAAMAGIIKREVKRHKAWPLVKELANIANHPALHTVDGMPETITEAAVRCYTVIYERNGNTGRQREDEIIEELDRLGVVRLLPAEEVAEAATKPSAS